MNADQYRRAIAYLGLSQAAASRFLGVSVRQGWGWANGEPIPHSVGLLLFLMVDRDIMPADITQSVEL